MQECKLIKRVLDLYITDFCNLKCKHCYNDEKKKSELNMEQVKQIVVKVNNFYSDNMEAINILGGEPFLHKDFYEIVDYCSKFAKVNTSTNAFYIIKTPIEILKKLNYIQLSVESMDRDIADYYRCKGFYDNLMKTVKFLKENEIQFGFKITINKDNFENIEEQFQKMKELGAQKISLSRMIPIGNGKQIEEKLISKQDFEIVMKKALIFMIKNNIQVDMSDGLWTCLVNEKLSKFKEKEMKKGRMLCWIRWNNCGSKRRHYGV